MRFDNPITKHNLFEMLDISEYSELESEFRQKKRIDLSVLTEKYSEQDLKGFNIDTFINTIEHKWVLFRPFLCVN